MAVPTSSQVTGVANVLLRQAGLQRVVHGIEQCGSVLFGQLYEAVTGARPPRGGESEAERCQAVVDALSEQLAPYVSLDHIRGRELAARDPLTIINLLDIFSVLFHVPTVRKIEKQPPHETSDDSHENVLSEEGLGVVSEVLQEELGSSAQYHTHSSSSYSANSTAEVLRPVPPLHPHLTPPPSLTIMSLTPSTIDQSETAPPTREGVDNTPTVQGSSKGQLTTPTTPPRETQPLNSPLHHSTPRPHQSKSRLPPSSMTSFPLLKSTLVSQHLPLPLPSLSLPLPSASLSETSVSSCSQTDEEEDEEDEVSSTHTLREEVESPHSTPDLESGNEMVENHTSAPPPSPAPETNPSHHVRTSGPPTPGEGSRRKILRSLYQRYMREQEKVPEESHRKSRKKAAVAVVNRPPPGRKNGVKPAGQRSGRLPTRTSNKHDNRENFKKQKFGVTSDLFPVVEASLPVCPVSMETMRDLWKKQLRQITTLTKPPPSHPHRVDQEIEAMGRKHLALLEALKKEIDHTRRLRGQEEVRAEQRAVRARLEAKRQATARARRYFRDYELDLKSKLQKKRTNEELVFRRAFEDGLALLREREREVRRLAKERKEQQKERLRRDLEAMEQYYSDQFSMLTESLSRERERAAVRDKAQAKLSSQLGREMREKLETEVKQLQACLDRDNDVTHFRELDAQQLRLALHHLLTPL